MQLMDHDLYYSYDQSERAQLYELNTQLLVKVNYYGEIAAEKKSFSLQREIKGIKALLLYKLERQKVTYN